jgi:Asp-tRNA(Asn)/Glu-tRNA(Gln) amidotransferase C subunit
MNQPLAELDGHIKNVMTAIAEAASKHDLLGIQRLTRKASELQELKEQMAAIQQRIVSLNSEPVEGIPVTTAQPINEKIRQLPIEVTDGMIRQNLLTLAAHVRTGKVKVGEELIIEAVPSGRRFQTALLEQSKKLRERGEIARFYRDAKVNGGDYVLLTETAPGRWTLRKAPPGEYGVARLLRDLV